MSETFANFLFIADFPSNTKQMVDIFSGMYLPVLSEKFKNSLFRYRVVNYDRQFPRLDTSLSSLVDTIVRWNKGMHICIAWGTVQIQTVTEESFPECPHFFCNL